MNLLYLFPFYPHLYAPYLFREMAWMRTRGHRVAVASMSYTPEGRVNVDLFSLADVPVLQLRRNYQSDGPLLGDLACLPGRGLLAPADIPLRESRRKHGLRHGLHYWTWIKRLSHFAAYHRIDVVDAHWATEASDAARRLNAATGIPYSVTLHGGDLYRAPSPDLPDIIRHASAVQPVSRYLVGLLTGAITQPELPLVPKVQVNPAVLRIRHHGLPQETIAAQPCPQSDDNLLVGATGRLDPEKRHIDLIDAVADLAPRFPRLKLLIIGGGRLENELRQRAQQRNIVDRLEITGPLPWPQVMQRVRQLAVYVQPSQLEGFGLATLEGASQGLPVIATRTGAHEQIVLDARTGFTYAPGDAPMLKTRLETLLTDKALRERMGAAALTHVRENFVFENLMPRVEAVLQAAADRKPLPQ